MNIRGSVGREWSEQRDAPPTQTTQLGPIAPIARLHGDYAKKTLEAEDHRGMHLPIHIKVKLATPDMHRGRPKPPDL